jgi:hypothetical protein
MNDIAYFEYALVLPEERYLIEVQTRRSDSGELRGQQEIESIAKECLALAIGEGHEGEVKDLKPDSINKSRAQMLKKPVQHLGGTSPKSERTKFSNVTGWTLHPQYHDVGRCVMIASQPQMQAGVTAINDQGLPRANNDRVRGKSRQLPIDPLPHPKGQAAMEGPFLAEKGFELLLSKPRREHHCTQQIQRDQASAHDRLQRFEQR